MKVWEKEGFFFTDDNFSEKMNSPVKDFIFGFEDGYFESRDKTKLHYNYRINPEEKAALVISHGFCEFFGKYHELAYYFYEAGYSIFLCEHRGHGFSDRVELKDEGMVYVQDFDEYVMDLKVFVETIVKPNQKSDKRVLLGHSMGGCIATLYAERYQSDFDRLVLSSPMLRMSYGGKPEWLAILALARADIRRLNKEYAPGQRGFNPGNWFEKSSTLSFPRWEYVQKLRLENPEYRTFGGTYAWLFAAVRASKAVMKNANKVNVPVLLIQAGLDTLVNNDFHDKFAKKAENVKIIRFANSKHEAFNANCCEREAFYKNIFTWLEEIQ